MRVGAESFCEAYAPFLVKEIPCACKNWQSQSEKRRFCR